jgi:alginate O-acetyltransferase complex protein AlgI
MREAKNKKIVPLRYALTMLVVVTGWVFFRSPNLRYALNYLGIMFGIVRPENAGFAIWYYLNPKTVFILGMAVLASTPLLKQLFSLAKFKDSVAYKCMASALILALFFVSLAFVTGSSYNPFIYFRF